MTTEVVPTYVSELPENGPFRPRKVAILGTTSFVLEFHAVLCKQEHAKKRPLGSAV